jgi:uncharacterized protein
MELTPGEKLTLLMLCDIHTSLKIKHGEVDPIIVKEAITSGHLWGLSEKFTGLSRIDETPPHVVQEVRDFLKVGYRLESDFADLSALDKQRVLKEADASADAVRFRGFDGNHEVEHFSAALFIVNQLGNYHAFKGRDLNSHAPMVGAYQRMHAAFNTTSLNEGKMSADHIIAVLKAQWHPERAVE